MRDESRMYTVVAVGDLWVVNNEIGTTIDTFSSFEEADARRTELEKENSQR